MILHCPKCPSRRLKKVAGKASFYRCGRCQGLWTHLEGGAPFDGLPQTPAESPKDADARTGLCPEGHGILLRARVELEPAFFLERCSHCLGLWFDSGEWQRLAEAHWLESLPDLFNESAQRLRRARQNEVEYHEWLRARVGPDLFEALRRVAGELQGQEFRGEALAFLRNASEGP